MFDELEETEVVEETDIIEEEIIETDYTDQTLRIKGKMIRKIKVVFVSSILVFITSLTDKHDDFDVVLKSDLFLFLIFMTIFVSLIILVFTFRTKDNYNDEKIYKVHKGLLDVYDLLSIVPVFMLVITLSNVFFVSPSFIDGASMEPNYYDGEDILFWHLNVEYERYDVVILKAPSGSYWIKRIIGLPGDTVTLDQGVVYINGEIINQDFLKDENGSIDSETICRVGNSNYCVFDVPEGEYFVLGDNRSVSDDSRSTSLGYVSTEQLFGKVIFKFNNFLRD